MANCFSMCSSSFQLVKNCDQLRTHPGFSIRAPRLLTLVIHPVSTRLQYLTGTAPRSALRAEPAENEFAFANDPLTEGGRGRFGHVVPLHVLNIAAAVADEMVMPRAFGIKSRGAAL